MHCIKIEIINYHYIAWYWYHKHIQHMSNTRALVGTTTVTNSDTGIPEIIVRTAENINIDGDYTVKFKGVSWDEIDDLVFTDAHVHNTETNENEINDDVRKSQYCSGVLVIDHNERTVYHDDYSSSDDEYSDWDTSDNCSRVDAELLNFINMFSDIYDLSIYNADVIPVSHRTPFVTDYGKDSANKSKWKLLKYGVGCHFGEHTDYRKDAIATVLLFLPGYTHSGGLLRITSSNGTVYEFDSNVDVPTYVAFNPSLVHEVTEVTEGTRYVLKATWLYSKRKLKLYNDIMYRDIDFDAMEPIDDTEYATKKCDIITQKVHKYIDEIVEKICDRTQDTSANTRGVADIVKLANEALSEYISLNDQCSYKVANILSYIEKSPNKYVAIALNSHYPNLDTLTRMKTDDLKLVRAIKTKYDNVSLKNFYSETCNDIYCDDKYLNLCDSWSNYGQFTIRDKYRYDDEHIRMVHLIKTRAKCGHVQHRTTYNDERDIKTIFQNFTAIVIGKEM
jgi:hypothetical protein